MAQPGSGPTERAVRLSSYFESGQAADLILAAMLAEALWLWRGRGWRPIDIATMLLPGLLIMLALRAAQVGAGWMAIAAPLTLSLPAHIWDVRRRERRIRNSP